MELSEGNWETQQQTVSLVESRSIAFKGCFWQLLDADQTALMNTNCIHSTYCKDIKHKVNNASALKDVSIIGSRFVGLQQQMHCCQVTYWRNKITISLNRCHGKMGTQPHENGTPVPKEPV